MNYVNVQTELVNSMKLVFQKMIKSVKYNYTVHGMVKAVLGDNEYKVVINGQESIVSGTTMPVSQYFVGNIVLIEVVNNDYSFKYIKCLKPKGV